MEENCKTYMDYLVTQDGRVFSKKGRERKQVLGSDGYYHISVYDNTHVRVLAIHRMVAELYVPNPNPATYRYVRHKDGNKLNNNYKNLEWSESKVGGNHCKQMRKIYVCDCDGNIINEYPSISSAARDHGVFPVTISNYLHHKSKDRRGYLWMFKPDSESSSDSENQLKKSAPITTPIENKVDLFGWSLSATHLPKIYYEDINVQSLSVGHTHSNIFLRVLSADLSLLGFSITESEIISALLTNGNWDKSKLLNYYKQYHDDCEISLDTLVKNNIVQYSKRKRYGSSLPVSICIIPHQSRELLTIFDNVTDKYEAFSDIESELLRLLSEFISAYGDGFIKSKYIPEFQKLVQYISKIEIDEYIAKYLVLLAIDPDSSFDRYLSEDVITLQEMKSANEKLLNYKWIVKSEDELGGYHLTMSLDSLILGHYYELKTIREKKLNEIAIMMEMINASQQKVIDNLNALQINFISSLKNKISSYNKISENILDLMVILRNGKLDKLRAYIVELTVSNDGNFALAKIDDKKPETENEILLFGWYKEAKQYVVWNFAKNYDILKSRSLIVPTNIFDLEIGNETILVKRLPSNAEVITCPESQPYKALKYWWEKKTETDDKWFI